MTDESPEARPPRREWAELHRQVVFGRSGGRIIWQPRIGAWGKDKAFAGEPLPAPYEGMSLPDLFLLDGIPAVYFDETFPVEVLVECTHKLIDLFAPKLVPGISDEISSTGDIERVRVVGGIVDEYNRSVPGGVPDSAGR